jgi:nucleoside-diphosphate-sugar epimerase
MSEESTAPGSHRVLVTGGAGYIGCVLVRRLAAAGYRVRVLDSRQRGPDPLAAADGDVERVEGDIRDARTVSATLAGVDSVVALAGPSNDSTAERDPEANWQANALATAQLGRECLRRGIARVVFASSCMLYDGRPDDVHHEGSTVTPVGAYATAKHHGEQALLSLAGEGLNPVVLRFGTVYGWSPRMRYDLVVNTFVRAALLEHRIMLHGGGRMRRPLVDVRDVSEAMVRALEAAPEVVGGQIFNVLHGNHEVREVAAIVARSVERRGVGVEIKAAPAPRPTRDYRCSGDKLASQMGFVPRHSVEKGVEHLLARLETRDHALATDS